jgi:hypothetical protein
MRGKLDVRAVHDFLNELWKNVFTLNEELKREFPKFGFRVEDVEEVFGAYIFLDGEWRQMNYPHPAFEIKPQIEVGATPESYYFVVAVPREDVSEEFIESFLEAFPRSFIYGSEDFLNDVYNCMRDSPLPEEIVMKMRESPEKVFQFEADFESVEELKEGLFKMVELGKRFEIFDL